jgi:hypothetical protein
MFEHAQGVASITLATVQQARPNVPAPPARQLQVKYCTVRSTAHGLGNTCRDQRAWQMPTPVQCLQKCLLKETLDTWKAFRAAPLRTGICFSLAANATTFALRLDGTLLSLLSIQSGPAMICRYFSPNPQEPTSKTTSVMTGGVEHDQGEHRQSFEKLLRLPFQTPPLLLHSQLLLSKSTFFNLQQSTHSS